MVSVLVIFLRVLCTVGCAMYHLHSFGFFLFLIFSFATSSFVFFLFPQTSWLRNVFSSSIMQIVFCEIFFLQVQPAVTGVSTCEVPKFQGIHINI